MLSFTAVSGDRSRTVNRNRAGRTYTSIHCFGADWFLYVVSLIDLRIKGNLEKISTSKESLSAFHFLSLRSLSTEKNIIYVDGLNTCQAVIRPTQ